MRGHKSLLSRSQICCDLQKSPTEPVLFAGNVRLCRLHICKSPQLPTVSFLARSVTLCDLLSALCCQLPPVPTLTSWLFPAPVFPEAQYYQSVLNKASAGWMLNWNVQYLSHIETGLRVSWDSLYIIHLM